MENDLFTQPSETTQCLRCGTLCQPGTPDPMARAIVKASTGLCGECILTKTLRSLHVLAPLIEKHGPECLEFDHIKPILFDLLRQTQLKPETVNFPLLIQQWHLPWPKGLGPVFSDF